MLGIKFAAQNVIDVSTVVTLSCHIEQVYRTRQHFVCSAKTDTAV